MQCCFSFRKRADGLQANSFLSAVESWVADTSRGLDLTTKYINVLICHASRCNLSTRGWTKYLVEGSIIQLFHQKRRIVLYIFMSW